MLIIRNLKKVFKNLAGLVGFFVGFAIIIVSSIYFMEPELIRNNLGEHYLYQELILMVLIALLFGIFVGSTVYKIKYFGSPNSSKLGMFGGLIGILVSGCPACSITLASYFGLAAIISVFPYGGLELKYLSVVILLYACHNTLINLEVCKIQKKKTIIKKR